MIARIRRSAELHSAVSPSWTRQGGPKAPDRGTAPPRPGRYGRLVDRTRPIWSATIGFERHAECNSAIQPIANRRYEENAACE
jgi:hypothetical protein